MAIIPSKPPQWAFQPHLVAPEWRWFLDNSLKSLPPLWEGGGFANLVDLANPGIKWAIVDGSAAVSWKASRVGIGVDAPQADVTNEAIITSDIVHGIGTGDFTVCWYGRVKPNSATNYQSLWGTNSFAPQGFLRPASDPRTWGMYWGSDRKAAEAAFSTGVDLHSTFVWRRIGSTVSQWRDGIKDANEFTISLSMGEGTWHIGANGQPTPTEPVDMTATFFSVHAKAFTDNQVRQWSANPYGPITRDDDVVAFLPAAAGVEIFPDSYLASAEVPIDPIEIVGY